MSTTFASEQCCDGDLARSRATWKLFDPLTSVYNSELIVSALGIPLAFADIDWLARCFAENVKVWEIELFSRMDSRNRRHPFQRIGWLLDCLSARSFEDDDSLSAIARVFAMITALAACCS
jgi:hypothetical protein